jgi:hypothetical protein
MSNSMKSARCDNLATEHVTTIRERRTNELHLCSSCAEIAAELSDARRIPLLVPQVPWAMRERNAHDFLRRWIAFRQTYGREPTDNELIDILRHIRRDFGGGSRDNARTIKRWLKSLMRVFDRRITRRG